MSDDWKPELQEESPECPASLRKLLDRYLVEKLIVFDPQTKRKHLSVLKHYERIVGSRVGHLSNANVARMMSKLIEDGLTVTTTNGYRAKLLAIWDWACRQNWIKKWPSVGKLPEPTRKPIAWTPEQVAKIWCGLAMLEGFVGGIPASIWWECYHGVMFDSGERHGARIRLRWEHFTDFENGKGIFPYSIRKGKTGDKSFELSAETVADLKKLRECGADPFVFPWPYSAEYFFQKYRKVLQFCGVPSDRYHLSHCGRKFVGTQMRKLAGKAAASETLGHADESTTNLYIDPDQIEQSWPHDILPNLRRPKDQGDPPRAA